MTWTKGRRLSTYTHNGTTYTFTYDGEGQRKTKTFGGTTVRYVYVDGKLLKELQTVNGEEKEILYQYDETGVIGFLYNGYQYYYRKNAQGDILSVHCGTDLHAMYTYDAWGNCTISFDAAGIGALNPFRYRGYYLDRETGLYYLMTRYYDPEIGRFVNADDVSYLDPEALNGCNLYSYCMNNPVMYSDPSGHFAISIFLACVIGGLIAGAIIGGTAGGIVAYNLAAETGSTGWELAGLTMLGVLGGAVLGGAVGTGIGAGIGGFAVLGGSIGGGSMFALAGGGALSGAGALATVSAGTAAGVGVGAGALGAGLLLMSKPNSGRIRFSDGTGTNPDGSKMSQKQAETAYKNSNDPVYKAKLKKWMKGVGYRHSHLKGLIFLPLAGEWFRRFLMGEW